MTIGKGKTTREQPNKYICFKHKLRCKILQQVMEEKPYGLLSLGVSVGVHQEPAKPSNLVAFLMEFLNWQEMPSLALVCTPAARHWTFLIIYLFHWRIHAWVIQQSWFARDYLGFSIKVLQPRKCLSLRQTRMVGHPTRLYTEGHPH